MPGRPRPPCTSVAQSLLLLNHAHALRQPAQDAEGWARPRRHRRAYHGDPQGPESAILTQLHTTDRTPLAASPTNRRLMHQLFCPKVGVEPPRTGDHGPHATDTSQQRRNGIGLSAAGTRPGVHSARSGRSAERGRPARHNKGSLNDAFRPQTARLAHISLVVRRTRAKMRLQQLTRVPSQIDGR